MNSPISRHQRDAQVACKILKVKLCSKQVMQSVKLSLQGTSHDVRLDVDQEISLDFVLVPDQSDTELLIAYENNQCCLRPTTSRRLLFDDQLQVNVTVLDPSLVVQTDYDEAVVQSATSDGDFQSLTILRRRPTASQGEGDSDLMGLLQIQAVAAKNLPSTVKLLQSWRGSLHPFAVVSLGKQTFRTKVARATLDPVWKQSAILYTHAVS